MSLKYDSTILVDGDEPTNRALLDILKKINEVSAIADRALSGTTPPVGYVYTQGPDDMSPSDLWPNGTWENVSSEEAGSFRRYEGGGASVFASGQQLDAFQGHRHSPLANSFVNGSGTPTVAGGAGGVSLLGVSTTTGDPVTDGSHGTPRTDSETRPVNYTVRKWRRTA